MHRRLRLIPVLLLCLLALAPASAQAAAVPGVNASGVSDPYVTDALATGAKYVRFFAVWPQLEPQRGHVDEAAIAPYGHAADRLAAAGAKAIIVVTNAPQWSHPGSTDVRTRPDDPAEYGRFMGALAASPALRGKGIVYELWNEPDEVHFWQPAPDAAHYTAMVRSAYPAIKRADPSASVLLGPMTGNNYAWLEALYANGAAGSFDGVGVHTDTACLVNSPTTYYRENGRIGRYTFLGYREVAATMRAHGDGAKKIWMTEFGWTSTTTPCQRGMWAGQKPAGVTETQQAEFMTQAWHCMAQDDSVAVAAWFNLTELPDHPDLELRHYGLVRSLGGARKPAWTAFTNYVRHGDTLTGACGDFDAPTVTIKRPSPGLRYATTVPVQVSGSDPNGLSSISLWVDGTRIRTFGAAAVAGGKTAGFEWFGASKLSLGTHRLTVVARDQQGNEAQTSVEITRVTPKALGRTVATSLQLGRLRLRGRTASIAGRLNQAGSELLLTGPVRVLWQVKRKGKWRHGHHASSKARLPFRFTQRLKQAGTWRARLTYPGVAPYKPITRTLKPFRVR